MSSVSFEHQTVRLGPGDSILDALLRAGQSVRWSCRAGSCQTCMMRVVRGQVPAGAQRGLRTELCDKGYFLPCKAFTATNLVIARPQAEDLRIEALIAEKQWLAEDICLVRLEVPEHVRPLPGQFLPVVHPDGSMRPYSVASRPEHDWFVDLHVRHVPEGKVSGWLCRETAVGEVLTLHPPAGGLLNQNPPPAQKLLLLATGTGLAPLLPILHEALALEDPAVQVWLFHGGRIRQDLYLHDELMGLSLKDPRLRYRPWLLNEPVAGVGFGHITAGLRQGFSDLSDFRVLLAGHPGMVADARHLCLSLNADSAAVASEAFAFDHVVPSSADSDNQISFRRRVPRPDPELWARLDNGRVLREVLRDFYQLAFMDQRLGPYFKGVTEQRLREKQFSFLRSLMLGTRDYFGQRPRNAHHWMVISDELFDYRLRLMTQCMRAHGVIEPWIQRWHAFEEFFREDIVKDQPVDRMIGDLVVRLDGVEDTIVDEGCLCDGCGQEIEAGSEVRFHLRLGTAYCRGCRQMANSVHESAL